MFESSSRVKVCSRIPGTDRRGGFALIATLVMMGLLLVVALGLLSLSTIAIRQSSGRNYDQEARANARLALIIALGELQRTLGPDQRVSAPAGLLDKQGSGARTMEHPRWTAVWSTRYTDGKSIWTRDDRTGGLRDRRFQEGYDPKAAVLSYLVSGNEGGRERQGAEFRTAFDAGSGAMVDVVGAGTTDAKVGATVSVPLVDVAGAGPRSGRYGYWIDDLGVKANVAVRNPYAGKVPDPASPDDGGYFRLMASQEVDETVMGGVDDFTEKDKGALLDSRQAELLASKDWVKEHYFDFTAYSRGVLADVREGGLKKDLTVYLKDGEIPPQGDLPGLADSDRLVGPRNEQHAAQLGVKWSAGRHAKCAPRFGMLRDWANETAGFSGARMAARVPESQANPVLFKGARAALANDAPTALSDKVRTDLQPVLVEGSTYSTFSYHPNPPGWRKLYNIRSHTWPRVVLWNPYNVTIRVPRSVIMLQLNTRNDFKTTDGISVWQWISWGGGTRSKPPAPFESITSSENYNDPYTGMSYFSLPEEEIGPGECYVYSAKQAAEYDSRNLLNNELSSEVGPDPSRNYYVSSSEFDDDDTGSGFNFTIKEFWYSPSTAWTQGRANNNQADDARMIWKRVGDLSSMDVYDFDELPQMQFVSCSLQYGAGREPRVAWAESRRVSVERTELNYNRRPLRLAPAVRTREGFRLRWLNEHQSNKLAQKNVGAEVLDTAPLANWNPRAAYSVRSPWENIDGDPGDGSASGPWFYGLYTRDMYDDNGVGWAAQMPRFSGGKFRGNPFGLPQEGHDRIILFDVAREGTGVVSLAQFQHAKLSDLVWHPSYPIGNSLVDPRLGTSGMDSTAPRFTGRGDVEVGGWSANAAGWAADTQRSEDRDEWARFARGILMDFPETDNLVHDLSFDLNFNLWDEFFLSTASREDYKELVEGGKALPNGRMLPRQGDFLTDAGDFHKAARAFYLNGAFNVNSTSVEAWKAVLSSTRPVGYGSEGSAAFPRVLNAPDGEWRAGQSPGSDAAWAGFRSLNEEEIARLAEEIVWQVKTRGPFLSMGDFVNRRLSQGEEGKKGALQAAIDAAGLNSAFANEYPIANSADLANYRHPDNIAEPIRLAQSLKPDSKAWGVPGFLTQADVLQVIGPMLTARSDSFRIRTYGDAVDADGKVKARVWCEAVVQRTPDPLGADRSGLNPDPGSGNGKWGRSFEVVSFRWLNPDEV